MKNQDIKLGKSRSEVKNKYFKKKSKSITHQMIKCSHGTARHPHFSRSACLPMQNLAPATRGHRFALCISKQGVLPMHLGTPPALNPSSSPT